MAKNHTPPNGSNPPLSSTRSPTAELTARALRAAERGSGEKQPPPSTEVATEILDQSMLPVDLDDQAVVAKDPRRRRSKSLTEQPVKTEPNLPRQTREEPRQTKDVPKQEKAEKAEKKPAEEDAKKAESLLQSFLAAAHTRREEPPKEAEPKPKLPEAPRAPPPPSAGSNGRGVPFVTGPLRPAAAATPAPTPGSRSGALHALNQAQPPGVYFREHSRDGRPEGEEDPKLAAAVEEAIGVLFGVRGIHHVGPGQNETGEAVVVVAAGPDFGEASLSAIPDNFGEYRTLVTLPFDLLPLRRNR